MFSWLRRKRKATKPVPVAKPEPDPAVRSPGAGEANAAATAAPAPKNDPYPRMGTHVRIAFANAGRTWEEQADLMQLLAGVLARNGRATGPHDDGLLERASGLVLRPEMRGFQPLDRGGVSTVTSVEVRHPAFGTAGIFEFQHAAKDNLEQSIEAGFEQWLRGDLPVLLDALREQPAECMRLEMMSPATADAPPRARRALLGPVAHYRQGSPPARPAGPSPADGEPEHDFCPCCLLTRSFEAFRSLFESEGFYGIRLYAARDADGKPQADCRVNGADWEAGKAALIRYAATWPPAGFEFRKQYVVLQNARPAPESAGNGGEGTTVGGA